MASILLSSSDGIASFGAGASLVFKPNSLRVMHQFALFSTLLAIGNEFKHQKLFTIGGHEFKSTTAFG